MFLSCCSGDRSPVMPWILQPPQWMGQEHLLDPDYSQMEQ